MKDGCIAGRLELELDQKVWYMKQMNPGQGVKEELYNIPPERDICFTGWNEAQIPGDVYSDLQRAGEIDDPYVGRNLVRLKWVQYCEWWYVCRFNAPDAFENKHLQLVLDGVVYGCEIWLNGHYLGKHEGMFSPIKFDVTKLVNTYIDVKNSSECDNHLWIKLDPAPQSFYNIAGKHHAFAGDYLPGFVPVGIWRSVRIIGTDNARIETIKVESERIDNGAVLSIDAHVEIKRGALTTYTAELKIWHKDDEPIIVRQPIQLHPGSNDIHYHVDVPNARLWWPWDMGEQPLYFATLCIEKDGVLLDNKTIRFGIRQVEMAMNPTYNEDETEFPWTFVINGKQIFLRSGCWGGPPSFLYGRNSYKKYRHFLELAKSCHLNNLRIFGWHPPETSDFYDICDELGITVWTNFPLATQVLRDDAAYVSSVLNECGEIVKERRNHPSNIYWMGGEEVYFSQAQVESHNKRMMKLIGKHIKEYTNVPYGDASMMSSSPALKLGYKPKESIHANGHYYAAGRYLMEDYFTNVDSAIIPELTAASVPSVESLKKFIPEDELWPIGRSWGYLMANVDILKALNVEVFGDERFGSLEEFAESTQIAQGEIFKFALEVIRRKKPRISGVAICHFITNRPLMKWEIVDYYGHPKKSYAYVQKAFQPLLVSIAYEKRRWMPNETFKGSIWVVNDLYKTHQDVSCTVKYMNANGNGTAILIETLDIKENTAEEKFLIEQKIIGEIGQTFRLEVCLKKGKEILSENDYKFIIGNQEEARQRGEEYYHIHRQRTLEHGKTMYRDFGGSIVLE